MLKNLHTLPCFRDYIYGYKSKKNQGQKKLTITTASKIMHAQSEQNFNKKKIFDNFSNQINQFELKKSPKRKSWIRKYPSDKTRCIN